MGKGGKHGGSCNSPSATLIYTFAAELPTQSEPLEVTCQPEKLKLKLQRMSLAVDPYLSEDMLPKLLTTEICSLRFDGKARAAQLPVPALLLIVFDFS